MRIAFVTQKVVRHDGQGRLNLVVIEHLLDRGHAVRVVASELAPELLARPGLAWSRIPESRLPTQLLKDQAFAWRATRAVARLRRDVDLVVVNGFVAWPRSDINVVNFVHASWLHSTAHPRRQAWDARGLYQTAYTLLNVVLERWTFRRTGVLVAVSRTVRDELVAIGIDPARIRIIDNGVDPAEFMPGPPPPEFRGGLGAGPVALFVGDARTNRKNLDGVIAALAEVPGVTLLVAGGADGGPFPALAKRLGLEDRVRFIGHRRDIAEVMRGADIFVFPSRYEPFGLVLLEAAATALPIITTRVAGASWLLEDAGIILDDPEDVPQLARALARLARDATLRAAMGRNGRAVAERRSWAATAQSYASLIEETAARGRDRRDPASARGADKALDLNLG